MGIFNHARYWRLLCRNCLRACLVGIVFLASNSAFADYTYTGSCAPGSYSSLSALITGCAGSAGINICKPFDVVGSCTGYSGNVNTAIGTMVNGGSRVFLWRSGTPPACSSSEELYNGQCVLKCSAGSTRNAAGQCVADCGPNEVKNSAGVCEDKCLSKKGQSIGFTANPTGDGCHTDGCYVALSSSGYSCSSKADPSKKMICGIREYTGTSCTPGTDSTSSYGPDTPEYDCYKKGKTYGYVNGRVVCVDRVTDNTAKDKTTNKTNPDGSTEKTTTNTTSTVNNTTNNVTTTTTTTTTKTNGDGTTSSETSTESEETDKDSFCKENPDSNICTKSTFNGACNGSFTCEGDAIQCALSQEVHQRNCALFDNKTTLSDLGDSLAGGTDPLGEDSPFKTDNKSLIDLSGNAGRIDQSRLWGGSCIPNQTVSVMGTSITFDTSKVCDAIGLFGNLFVAVTMLGAVLIIGKGA